MKKDLNPKTNYSIANEILFYLYLDDRVRDMF